MPPIDTTALAAIFTWVWDQYGKTIVDKAGKAVWERLRWEDRALAYAKKVQRLHGTMQILGQAKPVPLEGIFTAVSLLDKPTAWRRYTVAEMEAEFVGRGHRYFYGGKEANRRDGLAMVRGDENLFILGKPGAGKTTFLKYLALKGVSGELKRVPIFIGLKQLADSGLAVFDFVVREFDVCDFPDAAAYLDRLLKSGKAILLFDGLDEVNVADDERARLIDEVEGFTRKYDQCQRLITCRLAANEYGFQNYTYVEMADFSEDQISEFVAKWFSGDAKQEERCDLFLSELQKSESEGLRELARVPLLLALLCLGFEETLKLSSRRVELYEEALDALLKKWDSSRNIKRDEVYRELSLKRKEQMLAQVAAETFDRAEYFIPEKTLSHSFEDFLSRVPNASEEVDGEAILHAIVAQHGLFMERARGIHSFAHLTFQEYFTARYVVENEARGTLPRLIHQYNNPRYREVFLLTAAQLADASAFFDWFIERLSTNALEHPAVGVLLRQAARKAATAAAEIVSPAALRSVYVFFALALALAFALIHASAFAFALDRVLARAFDHVLARALVLVRALDRTRALDLDLDLALNPVLGISRAFDLDRALDLDLDRSLARTLAGSVNTRLGYDVSLMHARSRCGFGIVWPRAKGVRDLLISVGEYLAAAANQAGELGDFGAAERVTSVTSRAQSLIAGPHRENPHVAARRLAAELDTILEAEDLNFPTLDYNDIEALSRYLGGNVLLLDCLDQAVVADREAIKDRLLLLPEA